ncbi:MAG: ATP-binding protein [Mariprofundaceae bacterium]|nr:ATP-binding protein [Mariprofundaceae bacterium]
MLVNFTVENFKSFKGLAEFSLEATKLKNLKESNTFTINNMSLLTSAVIYGANASGKSSVLDAINLMTNIIKSSVNMEKAESYKPHPFLLSQEKEDQPTKFEIEFIIGETIYLYGFEIGIDAKILKEWLFQKNLKLRARYKPLFERIENNIDIKPSFKEGSNLRSKTRGNALFLTVVAQFNGEISELIIQEMNNINVLSNTESQSFQNYSFDKLDDIDFKDKMLSLIKSADTGIYDISKHDVSLEQVVKENSQLGKLPSFLLDKMKEDGLSTIKTEHIQYAKGDQFHAIKTFNLNMESEGTQKLLALSAPIIDTLENGRVLIIDELDNSLHTDLVEAIIKLFNSEDTNPKHAQLIFTTHDTNQLSQKTFRRDQIWFTEKNILGQSELYSLAEYGKGKARDDLVLEKNYLDGKFGAVPHIHSLDYEVSHES